MQTRSLLKTTLLATFVALTTLSALTALSAASAPVSGQDTAALRQRLQLHLDSLHAAGRFPGATVGIVLPDGRSEAFAVGRADTVLDVPMTTDARMLAGSVGKTYVAALAMQVMGAGRFELDAPVSRYLGDEPWFARLPNARDITVRHLMTHTSGIIRYEFNPRVTEILTNEPDHVWTPAERVSFLLDAEPPFAAGEGWDYSDTNYILLGMIIERTTGQALNDLIQRSLLTPLGLRNTIPSDRRRLPGVVQGYAGAQNPFGGRDAMIEDGQFIVNPQMEWAGGGYATTAEDLARWGWLLYRGQAFPPQHLPTMLDGVPARLGPDTRYGLGVIIRPTPHGISHGHSGFFPGYLTELRYYPELGVSVAVQFNTSVARSIGRNPSSEIDLIAGIVAEHLLTQRRRDAEAPRDTQLTACPNPGGAQARDHRPSLAGPAPTTRVQPRRRAVLQLP